MPLRLKSLRRDCATAVFVAVDGKAAGIIAIADPIKPTTPAAIEALHREGIRIVMLTGDNRTTAEAVARRLGIDEVEADVLPDRKSEVIQRLRKEGRVVAMAGDGVNDAPALATADVGIAMGTGTDVAIESAGVTLLGGDLTGIVRARRLSHATMRNIRQNLFFAFIYNAAGVPVAAGVLYPTFGILLSPDHRGGSHGPLVGQCHWQRAPTAGRAPVTTEEKDTWTERRTGVSSPPLIEPTLRYCSRNRARRPRPRKKRRTKPNTD